MPFVVFFIRLIADDFSRDIQSMNRRFGCITLAILFSYDQVRSGFYLVQDFMRSIERYHLQIITVVRFGGVVAGDDRSRRRM